MAGHRKNLCLLVIDMQEHFREVAERVLQPVNSLIEACQGAGVRIVYTQHGHPNPQAEEAEGSVLVRWWGAKGSIRLGSPAWEVIKELLLQQDSPLTAVITSKLMYDAFQGTELLQLLQGWGVDTVLVVGVMTNLCCETTARSAFTKDFNVLFLSDGTATATQGMHAATLLNLGYALPGCSHVQRPAAWSAARRLWMQRLQRQAAGLLAS